uniref:Uncharacterized protein n=1 Tax=Sphenodon punctatus TaxID=8508 RepID=A0A8D0HTR8_SPHPU
MLPSTIGRFQISCAISSHQQAGMEAYVSVEVCPEEPKRMRVAEQPSDEDYFSYDNNYDDDSVVITFDEDDTSPAVNARSFAKQRPVTWTHYIAAVEEDWDYAPDITSYFDSSHVNQFLESGPQRIGSKYKKVRYVEYEDGSFKKRKVLTQGMGILGPVLKGEIG